MFTGIVEEIGSIAQIKRGGKTLELVINAKIIMSDMKLGDSIAVNGVCQPLHILTRIILVLMLCP